jgi:hypothetical protein
MHFFQNAFFLDFFSVLRSFYGKTFIFYRDGVFVILKTSKKTSKNPLQAMTNTKTKFFMNLQRNF